MGRLSISLPDELITRLENFISRNKNYDGASDFIRHLLTEFFKPEQKAYLVLFMLYLGYPFLLMTILLKAFLDTGNILYTYLSAGISGLLLAGLYLFVSKHRGKK